MAERCVRDCDSCGARDIPQVKQIVVCVGYQYDSTGTEDVQRIVDLCPMCQSLELQNFLNEMSVEDIVLWLEGLKNRRKSPS